MVFQIPGLRIIKLEEDMAKYKPDAYDLSESGLVGFVQSFLDGKLKQHLLSQDLPEDWDKEPVKVSFSKCIQDFEIWSGIMLSVLKVIGLKLCKQMIYVDIICAFNITITLLCYENGMQ